MYTLIVDDSPGFRSLLQIILTPFGPSDPACDGEECVRMFEDAHKRGAPYDLICLDLSMPKQNGLDTLKTLRYIERSWNIPEAKIVKILMITSSSERSHILEAHSRNCQGYILKPFKKNKIIEKLAEIGLAREEEPIRDDAEAPSPLPPGYEQDSDDDPKIAGHVRLFVRPSSPELGLATAPSPGSKQPNYFKLLRAFDSVRKGQAIAIPKGTPDASLAGDGVIYDPVKAVYKAGFDGRVEIGDGNILSVKDLVVLHCDVDIKTGPVEFPGRVEVRGGVKDGFGVKAGKGVAISGTVGASHIESNGDVTADAVRAQGRGMIKCGGGFQAKSVSHAVVECRGDVSVGTEILQSCVKAGGSILIPEGQIAGGECVALKCVDVARTGTEKQALTKLTVGTDYLMVDCVQFLKKQIDTLTLRLDEINRSLAPYSDYLPLKSERFSELSEKRRTQIVALVEEKRAIEEQKPQIEKQYASISTESEVDADAKVIVRQSLMGGTVVSIGTVSKIFNENVNGPVSIVRSNDVLVVG